MSIASVINMEHEVGLQVDRIIAEEIQGGRPVKSDKSIWVIKNRVNGKSLPEKYALASQALYYGARVDLVESLHLQSSILTMSERVSTVHGQKYCISFLTALLEMKDPLLDKIDDPETRTHKGTLLRVDACNKLYLLKSEDKNTSEIIWKKMHESMLWIKEILSYCIEGVTFINQDKIPETPDAAGIFQVSRWKGVNNHTEASLGTFMEEFLADKDLKFGKMSPAELVREAKNTKWYQEFRRRLSNEEMGGYKRYIDATHQYTYEQIVAAIDTYLLYQVHLQQALYMEKNLLTLFHAALQVLGPTKTIELIYSVNQGPSSLEKALSEMPDVTQDLKEKFLYLANLFFYAAIKREGGFFDAQDTSGKKVRWSLMWVDLLREHLIKTVFAIIEDRYYPQISAQGVSEKKEPLPMPFSAFQMFRVRKGHPATKERLLEKEWKESSTPEMCTRMCTSAGEVFDGISLQLKRHQEILLMIKLFLDSPRFIQLELKFSDDSYTYCFAKEGDIASLSRAFSGVEKLSHLEKIALSEHEENLQVSESITQGDRVIKREKTTMGRTVLARFAHISMFAKLIYNNRELESVSVSQHVPSADDKSLQVKTIVYERFVAPETK